MIVDPKKLTRTCGRCLCDEKSPDAKKPCPDHKAGSHRFVSSRIAVAIVATDVFDASSEGTLKSVFSENCWQRPDYQYARLLSDREVEQLLSGKYRLAVVVVRSS